MQNQSEILPPPLKHRGGSKQTMSSVKQSIKNSICPKAAPEGFYRTK